MTALTGGRIAKLLGDAEPETRRLAVQQLAQLRGADVAPLLAKALGDLDWRVRKEAASVASSIDPRDSVLAELRTALADRVNLGLRNAAVEALVGIGPDALPVAIEAYDSLDEDGRKLAVEVLAGVPDVRGTVALTQALRDEDPNVRVAAAEALGRSGDAGEEARQLAITALLRVLASEETMLKLAALDALARLDAKLSWRTVEAFAKDPILKRYALAAAAASREVDAIRALAEAVGDSSSIVAREAVIALGEAVLADPDDAHLVETASAELRPMTRAHTTVRMMAEGDESIHARGMAITALGLMRDPADVPVLVDALSDPEFSDNAEVALKVFGEDALEPLMEAGRSAAPNVRGASLSMVPALSQPEDETEVLAVMRDALRDPSTDVILAAMRVFGRAGTAADVRPVARFALHPDPRVADAGDSALHELAPRHEEEARALLGEVDASREEAVIGCIIVDALARKGGATTSDAAFLRRALSNGDLRARRHAVEALSSVGDVHAAETVAFALADEEAEVVLAAVRALGRLGRAEPLVALLGAARDPTTVAAALRALAEADRDRALEAAQPLVRSPDAGIASAAVEALGTLRGAARDDALFAALEHGDTEVVKLALSELGRAVDARALNRIGMALDHIARDVRRLAAELLGQDGSIAAHGLLRARLEREKDVSVRVAIASALSARRSGTGGEEAR
ncbi:MAG: HEAT repeat domain-containing protein [Polyangiaceae bacterium]|jgi:HEAT repeat protein